MLEDEDILRLQKLFMDIKRNNKKLGTPNQLRLPAPGIRTVLREENILLDVCCTDWKEVIQKAAEPLLAAGSIDARYIDAMIRSYETNGSYFVYCPGVALAHAGPERRIVSLQITVNPSCSQEEVNGCMDGIGGQETQCFHCVPQTGIGESDSGT